VTSAYNGRETFSIQQGPYSIANEEDKVNEVEAEGLGERISGLQNTGV
jgi:hypothetical protein